MKPLIIFELANNHQGSVAHGLTIIRQMAQIAKPYRGEFDFAIKLQLRHLETFIHPRYREDVRNKHIKRFLSTGLSMEYLQAFVDVIRANDMTPMATPFDEPSVGLFRELDLEILKIGSCSLTDWPLWECAADSLPAAIPIIASTAGASWAEIDAVVQFCKHRGRNLTIMHCIGEYPTPPERANMGQISLLRQRYGLPVGLSSHEDRTEPSDSALVAIGHGATVFERHVAALGAGAINDYSLTRYEVGKWLQILRDGFILNGETAERYTPAVAELDSLRSLQRGVWAARDYQPGDEIHAVTYSIPVQLGQYTANDWGKWMRYKAVEPIRAGEPVTVISAEAQNIRPLVIDAMERVRSFVRGTPIPAGSELELSHHYGIENFYRAGCAMITIVNREYCKKLVILLPGQLHPEQYHQHKEETFHILNGSVSVLLNGDDRRELVTGQTLTIERGVKHAMRTETGVIIEEISTNHQVGDSYYTDPLITANLNRKTRLPYWME